MKNRTIKRTMAGALLLVFVLASHPGAAVAQETAKKLNTLAVSIWPEYDRAATALIIFRGEFPEDVDLPAKVKFSFPSRAQLSSTSSVKESGEFQYDKEWNSKELVEKGDLTELTYTVYERRFQFELYDSLATATEERSYSFPVRVDMATDKLDIDVQTPLKATDFSATPAHTGTSNDQQGFSYLTYELGKAEPGQVTDFEIKYKKTGDEPSVTGQTDPAATPSASGGGTNPWIIGAVILGLLAIPVVFYLLARQQRTTAGVGSAGKRARGMGKVKYCTKCGTALGPSDKFCPSCGART